MKCSQEEEIAELRRQIRDLKRENFDLRLNSSINLATAMVMSEEFGCDLETYKKSRWYDIAHTVTEKLPESMRMKVSPVCDALEHSRRSYYKERKVRRRKAVDEGLVISFVVSARIEHPRCGVRKLCVYIREDLKRAGIKVGRDRLFEILRIHDMLVEKRKGFEDLNTQEIARGVVRDIGYDRAEEGFAWKTFNYVSALHGQSPDIAQGVNRAKAEKQGAGDQGMMFGYATNETPSYMPTALVYSHELLLVFAKLRKTGKMPFLRPDSKSQLSVAYENGRPVSIETVVISLQTTEEGANRKCYAQIEEFARKYLAKTKLLTPKTRFFINSTGKFVVGGPCGDSGLTGRKIIVDTYGGMAAHGGGAFSGKDPSKVDRSAAYYARYAAKNIVAAKLADRCQIQVAYAIGIDKPVSVCVKTFGTNHGVTNEQLERMILSGKVFDFRPYALIRDLGLMRPKGWSYRDTAAYGHFGRDIFPWEKTDRVEAVAAYFKNAR